MINYTEKLKKIKNPYDKSILESLLTGPQTRAALVRLTKRDDRRNRESIERLRNMGIVIVSTSKGAGYRLAENESEVRSFVDDMQSRARNAFRTASRVKRAYNLRDQMELAS